MEFCNPHEGSRGTSSIINAKWVQMRIDTASCSWLAINLPLASEYSSC